MVRERNDLVLAAPVVRLLDPLGVLVDGRAQQDRARLGVRVGRRGVGADAAQLFLRRVRDGVGAVNQVRYRVEEARVVVGHGAPHAFHDGVQVSPMERSNAAEMHTAVPSQE